MRIEENNFSIIIYLRLGIQKRYTRKGISKNKYLIELTKTFQRRFRQELVNGKIDQRMLTNQ